MRKKVFSYRSLVLFAVGYFILGPCLTFLWSRLGRKTSNFDEVEGNSNIYMKDDSEVISSFFEHPMMLILSTQTESDDDQKEAERLGN